MIEQNHQLIKSWSDQVSYLLNIHKNLIETGKFVLFSCSASYIEFKNDHYTLRFCYDYHRYSGGRHMQFERLEIITDENSYSLKELMQLHEPGFDMEAHLRTNSKAFKSKNQTYQALIEQHFLSAIVDGSLDNFSLT